LPALKNPAWTSYLYTTSAQVGRCRFEASGGGCKGAGIEALGDIPWASLKESLNAPEYAYPLFGKAYIVTSVAGRDEQ